MADTLDRADTKWGACPYCGDDMIEGGSFDMEADQVWQKVSCLRCHSRWYEVYGAVSRERCFGEDPFPDPDPACNHDDESMIVTVAICEACGETLDARGI